MDFFIYLTFTLIILISGKKIFQKDIKTYSINRFLWIYVLIFWGTAPLIQYSFKAFPWDVDISDAAALKANSFILAWILVYSFFYKKFSSKCPVEYKNHLPVAPFKLKLLGIWMLLLLQISIFLFFFLQNGKLFFLRGESMGTEIIGGNRSIHLVVSQVLRGMTAISALILLMNYKINKSFGNFCIFSVSFVLLLLTNFPLAIARYMAGAFYIAVLFVYKPIFKRKNTVVIGLLLLFLVIYPATSVLRAISDFSSFSYVGTSLKSFLSGDFDNYSTLNLTISHVEKNGITFGRQLLGVLLFFVPRSLWPNKPIGSGAFVAESHYWDFTNISSPIIAEGYINFGIFGIVLFAAIIGYIVARFDSKFYKCGKLSFIKVYYPLALGLIFFILRGDLMSSFAYSVSFAVAGYLVLFITKPFIKNFKSIENTASN